MTTTPWDTLPDTIRTFMTALNTRDHERALEVLTPDAWATDEGHDYRGIDEIRTWLATAGTEYTYTTEFTGATVTDSTVDVTQHLDGDFPGGVVDLNYRFTLDGDLISRVVIEP